MIETVLTTLLPVFMYAETHYRFPGMASRLYKSEPEILADVPSRIHRGEPLPVAIIIKDSHRFPIELCSVQVHIGKSVFMFERNRTVQEPLWHELLYLALPDECAGVTAIDVTIRARSKDKLLLVRNDNLPTASHRPFTIQVDDQPLPGADRCLWGDWHCHSQYTDDQVEFGPPLEVLAAMAKANGLDLVGVADHSYDLDDLAGDYMHNDPQFGKWHDLQQAARLCSEKTGIRLFPGEELSVGNNRDQNLHLLIFNDPTFYEGYGDSGEQALRTRPRHRLADLLPRLSRDAVVFAAHPEARPPWPQRLLLKREKWSAPDYGHQGLHGMQIWNGEGARGFEEGMAAWIRELLQGRRLAVLGGNDSHGDFNRVRHVKIPFWSILESPHHVFGRVRTGVYVQRGASSTDILAGIKAGQSCISNGPFALLRVDGHLPGSVLTTPPAQVEVLLETTAAFGDLAQARLLIGDTDAKTERVCPIALSDSRFIQETMPAERWPRKGYLRLDVESKTGKQKCRCLTNPVYLDT
jgi:hypothetical protein